MSAGSRPCRINIRACRIQPHHWYDYGAFEVLRGVTAAPNSEKPTTGCMQSTHAPNTSREVGAILVPIGKRTDTSLPADGRELDGECYDSREIASASVPRLLSSGPATEG